MHFFENAYRLINKYNQASKQAKHYGTDDLLYPAEVHMIEMIGSCEKITTTKLAEVLGITKGAVSQITRKLSEKGLLQKTASGEKRNEMLLSLTEKGGVVFRCHRKLHGDMLRKIDAICSQLSPEGKNALNALLRVVEESLDNMEKGK